MKTFYKTKTFPSTNPSVARSTHSCASYLFVVTYRITDLFKRNTEKAAAKAKTALTIAQENSFKKKERSRGR